MFRKTDRIQVPDLFFHCACMLGYAELLVVMMAAELLAVALVWFYILEIEVKLAKQR